MKRTGVSDLDTLPVVLTLDEIAEIYRISPATIRRGLQNGTFRPVPWERYPYRWKRDDVAADLTRFHDRGPKRAHGFASVNGKARRQAKATLKTKPAARRTGTR